MNNVTQTVHEGPSVNIPGSATDRYLRSLQGHFDEVRDAARVLLRTCAELETHVEVRLLEHVAPLKTRARAAFGALVEDLEWIEEGMTSPRLRSYVLEDAGHVVAAKPDATSETDEKPEPATAGDQRRDFSDAVARAQRCTRGSTLAPVLNAASNDLGLLTHYIESNGSNMANCDAVIRQLIEIGDVLDAAVAELNKAKAVSQ